MPVRSENNCSRKNGIKALIPPHIWLPWWLSLTTTEFFIEAPQPDRIFPLRHRNRQASDLKRVPLKKAAGQLFSHTSHQSPSPRRPASIRPPSLKHQESLYLYDWKSATNLATKCWDIFSFHVFFFVFFCGGFGRAGGWEVSWKGLLLAHVCSALVSYCLSSVS